MLKDTLNPLLRPDFALGNFLSSSAGSNFNQSEAVTFIGSQDNENVTVCRAHVTAQVTVPGKFMPSQKKCFVPLTEEQSFSKYEILLVTPGMEWQLVRKGETPANALLAGHEDGHPLLFCRTVFDQNGKPISLPGKVITKARAGNGCWFPFHGVRDAGYFYEILVSNA